MSTVTQFVSAIQTLFGGRFYPDVAPANTKLPYATWSQVGGPANSFVEGANPSKLSARIQINVWAKDVVEARAKMNAVSDAVVAMPIVGTPEGAAISAYSVPSPNVRGMHQDFLIWFDK
jgi:hypothetical protein